ncbi:hypothetical protein BRC93_05190 [Halobacteriales archaeon QS_5_70_15]|nr:MAG: hypothetical protein BRC93_05190 [Halobacteriales archaeon QS_5_70_15]
MTNSGLSTLEAWPASGTTCTSTSAFGSPSGTRACIARRVAGVCSPYSTGAGAVVAAPSKPLDGNAAIAPVIFTNFRWGMVGASSMSR